MSEFMHEFRALSPSEGDGIDFDAPIPSRPIAGNTSDDDGEALDQFFQPMDTGPLPYGIPNAKTDTLPQTRRVLTRKIDLDDYSVGQSVLLFPPDIRRKYMHLEGLVSGFSEEYLDDAPIDGTYTILGPYELGQNQGFAALMRTETAGVGGAMELQVSNDAVDWTTFQSRTITAVGSTISTLGPAYRYVRIQLVNANTSGEMQAQVTADSSAEEFAWSGEPQTEGSMVGVLAPTDFSDYTGPVYVCKTVARPLTIRGWVVTE